LGDIIKLIPGYDPYKGAKDYFFDNKIAAAVIDFFQRELLHVKGEKQGKPFKLELWEKAIIANLFGWKHKKTKLRRYREAFIEIARKNGKTPLAAGILLYLLFCDNEPGAEIYGAASEYKQASLVFTWAQGMAAQNDGCMYRWDVDDKGEITKEPKFQVFKGQAKAIQIGSPGESEYAVYRVISSDSFAAHGFNTHAAVVDELHTQPNAELVDALLTSVGARRQPLIVYITTSDYEREGSICNQKEDYAIHVRDGVIEDPSFLPVVYKASLEDDWTDEQVWRKANPNLGVSVSLDYLRRECKRAQETPTYENTFKRLHLNIRTQQEVRWIPIETWDKCAGPVCEGELGDALGLAALDMSSTADVTAFVAVFRHGGKIRVVPRFWIPKDNAIKREERDRVPYLTWAQQGLIKLTDGNVVDHDVVRADINALAEQYNFKKIAIDPWNATQISTQLGGDGFEVVAFRQGFASMSAPCKEFERLTLEGGLAHGGHPVLRWMASNVSVEIDAAGNLKPSKAKSTERIDGIVALIMAIGVMIAEPEDTDSVYETRGALVL
jgi:phage terminase large subunit-like protein